MNVLIVHPYKGFHGGAEEVVSKLGQELTFKNHGVMLIQEGNYARLWAKTQHLGNRWADIINCHNFPATLAAFPMKKPIIWTCNEPPEYFTNWWRKPIEAFNRKWVAKSGMTVVVSDQINARRFFRLYGIEPKIVPYGINYLFWSRNPGVERRKDPIILQVGHKEFFPVGKSVFSKVQKKYPNVQLIQLWDVPQGSIREAYHYSTVLLHPVKNQGGWLVPFEAMSAGLPVVTTVDFTASSLVKKLGGLATIYSIDEMASSVCTILDNYDNFKDNQKAKEYIREELSWEKYGERMEAIFEEVLNAN